MPILREFPVRDAVEGVVETRLELASTLDEYGGRVRAGIALTVVGLLVAMVSVLPAGLSVAMDLLDILREAFEPTFAWWVVAGVELTLMVFVWSIGATLLLFMYQSLRFLGTTRARYEVFQRMNREGPPAGAPSARAEPPSGGEAKPSDAAMVLMSLVSEVEEQVPQVDRMHKFTAAFTAMLLAFLGVQFALYAVGLSTVHGTLLLLTAGLQAAAAVLVAASLGLMMEVGRFLRYIRGRHIAMETFAATPPCPVPPGPDVVARFMRCLAATEDLVGWDEGATRPMVFEGLEGRRHAFDAAAGGPGSRVLVRAFDRAPTLEEVRALRQAAEDVSRRDGRLPRRVVALVREGEADVPDEVYAFLLESPIMDARGERTRTLQVVSESEGYYCPVPFVAPDS